MYIFQFMMYPFLKLPVKYVGYDIYPGNRNRLTKNSYFVFSDFEVGCSNTFRQIWNPLVSLKKLKNILYEKMARGKTMKDFVFSSKSELMSVLCSQFSGLCIFQGRGVTMRKPWSKIFFDEKMPRSSCCFMADLICWSRSCALDVFVTDGPISHTQMDS